MRGAFLCLTLLLVNTLAFNIFVNKRQDDASDKVQVDFFYESLCPYCQQFMERSLKTAANTKVHHHSLRTFGKYVISDCSPTEMPEDREMELTTGLSPASTELENAKEMLLRLALSSSMKTSSTATCFLLSFVWKETPTTGFLRAKNAQLNTVSTGRKFPDVPSQSREGTLWPNLLMRLTSFSQLTPMSLGWW